MPRPLVTLSSLAALSAAALLALAGTTVAKDAKLAIPKYPHLLAAESRSKELCESVPNRVFVRHRLGSECLAYFLTDGHRLSRRAIVFMEGDLAPEKLTPEYQGKLLETQRRFMQRLADRYGLPYVALSRPGVLGSSGSHGQRRKPGEVMSVDAAIDAIKARHGFDFISLAGQSGGSTLVASLLALGRRDIGCAVLGAGHLAVVDLFLERQHLYGTAFSRAVAERTFFDPSRKVGGIVADAARRILVVGDPHDQRTPFSQQLAYAERVRRAGHHAHVVEIVGTGPERHGATHVALPAAALCTLSVPDEAITARLAPKPPSPTTASVPAPGGALAR